MPVSGRDNRVTKRSAPQPKHKSIALVIPTLDVTFTG